MDHNLLVKPGAKRSDITEIYSHQQALSQCEQYLRPSR
ncbi:MAG: prephenate dehydratase domain-containing protein [Dysosmobacter welbionis]